MSVPSSVPAFSLDTVLRPHIRQLVPYSSARDEYTGKEGIFLDANENPIGSTTAQPHNRYPDPYQWAVKEALAPIKGVRPEQIFLGNGSDEGIDLLIRATCTPGQDSILIMPPTYGMYEVSASINEVNIIRVPLLAETFALDTEAVLGAVQPHTKLIFICSPNNPTANRLEKSAIRRILQGFSGLVAVDEAYIDFNPEGSFVAELEKYPNLVVLQTFSKAWGLASLRLGMAFASPEIVQVLNKIKPPYNINGPTQELALQALLAVNMKDRMVDEILAERQKLSESLQALLIVTKVFPSDANFILARFTNASAVFHYLLEQKIIVRDRSRVMLCDGCLRITVGTAAENQELLKALRNWSEVSN